MLNHFRLYRPVLPWLRAGLGISFCTNLLLLASPIYMMQIYDRVLVSRSFPTLGMLTLITVGLVVAYGILDAIRSKILARAGYLLEEDLAPRVLSVIHDFQGLHPGSGAEGLRDVSMVKSYLSSQHLMALFDAPWAPVFTLVIFLFSWKLGLLTLIGVALLLGLALYDEKSTYRLFSQANATTAQAMQFAHGSTRNAEVVHALGMKPAMLAIWRSLAAQARGKLKVAADRAANISSLAKVLRTGIQVAMLGFAAYLVIAENLSSGVMIAATIIVGRAIAPVEAAIGGWKGFIEVRNAYQRLDKLLAHLENQEAKLPLPPIAGRIELQNVAYGFGPDSMLFSNVSMDIAPGTAICLVGPNGSGKSTLARIMLGLVPTNQGKVLLDGYGLEQYDRAALGSQLGYVPQNIELFGGTIAQNIARMQDAGQHGAEIVTAIEQVGLKPLLARLPGGYNTPLTENGFNLSGGQRQLVALARAFFGSPKLIVLDEPDAGLDQEGEANLLRIIADVRKERSATLIIISHNPRIIDLMDYLLMIKNGTAVQLSRATGSTASVIPISADHGKINN